MGDQDMTVGKPDRVLRLLKDGLNPKLANNISVDIIPNAGHNWFKEVDPVAQPGIRRVVEILS